MAQNQIDFQDTVNLSKNHATSSRANSSPNSGTLVMRIIREFRSFFPQGSNISQGSNIPKSSQIYAEPVIEKIRRVLKGLQPFSVPARDRFAFQSALFQEHSPGLAGDNPAHPDDQIWKIP